MKSELFNAGRRDFLVKSAAVSGGLTLGIHFSGSVFAADAPAITEVTH